MDNLVIESESALAGQRGAGGGDADDNARLGLFRNVPDLDRPGIRRAQARLEGQPNHQKITHDFRTGESSALGALASRDKRAATTGPFAAQTGANRGHSQAGNKRSSRNSGEPSESEGTAE